jgi:hypothetical protein
VGWVTRRNLFLQVKRGLAPPGLFPLTYSAKIPIKNNGVQPEMQACSPPKIKNRAYELVVTRPQLPRPRPWPMCQSKHTGHEGGNIQRICAAIVAANALRRPYDHHNWQRLGTTIRQRVVPKIVIKIVITIFFSSFNNVVLSNSMFVDCCMLCCRERDPIVAVG